MAPSRACRFYRRSIKGGMTLRIHVSLLAAAGLAAASAAFAVEVGQPMPAVPIAQPFTKGGESVNIGAFRGKVLYVDFWASWCVPCRTSMPALESLYAKYKDRGFVVVGVNKDDRWTDAERFLQKYPASFPLASDVDEKIVKTFAVPAMPSGYLIDRKGVVRQVHTGFTAETGQVLDREIDSLLKAAP